MKKIYLKPVAEFHVLGLTALMAASGNEKADWEFDQNTDGSQKPGSGSLEKEDGGESFSKGHTFNAWEEWDEE